MSLVSIFKNSFKYPLLNYKNWAILSILFVIGNIMMILTPFISNEDFFNSDIVLILEIVSIIVAIFVSGYTLRIIKNSIESSGKMPDFNAKKDFINGLKHIIVLIAYFIIPFLIFIDLTVVMNNVLYFFDFQTLTFVKTTFEGQTTFMEDIIPDMSVLIDIIITAIVFLVFSLFELIAVSRLAETDSLKEAFNFTAIFRDFRRMGLKLFIGLIGIFLITLFISFIVSFITGILIELMFELLAVGTIISLIGYAYLTILSYNAIGQIYKN